jgi:hypothetical protein
MTTNSPLRVAIVYPGNAEARRNATAENNRFADLFAAFAAEGVDAQPAVYHDDFCSEVREQLFKVDAALVWVNPVEGGHDRSRLDSMLREVEAAGVFVSARPDVILKLGTKEVLYATRELGWGSDTYLYTSAEQLMTGLPLRIADGKARVLKQYRGQSGDGVWKVQLPDASSTTPQRETIVRARHAKRGCVEEEMTLGAFFDRCQQYFAGDGRMIDQAYQERLPEGMIRCYLVHDKVAGFGHQAINALFPAPPGATPSDVPQPGPRFYHPPTKPEFQAVKHKLEHEWVPCLQHALHIDKKNLPVLWDCDFLLGPRDETGEDTYVLCEINVSSVAPYPESAVPAIVRAAAARAAEAKAARCR